MTSKINHSGDGETVSFSFPFFIPAKTALEVRVGGAIRAEGFNIVGAACPEGGKVVFDAPPASGEQVSLRYRGGVSVTVDDSTFGHLADKLVGGTNVTVTPETLDGGVGRLVISGTPDGRVDGLQTSVSNLGTRVGNAEASVSNLGARVGNAETSVSNLGTRVGSAEASMSTLGTRVGNAEASVSTLGTRVGNAETSVSNLSTALADAQADLVGVAYLAVAQDWTKPQRSNALPLNGVGGSVTLDFAQSQNFDITLTADITFANPVLTGVVGQKGSIGIVPNGHAIATMGDKWKRVGETGSPSEITGYGRIDYHVRSTSRIEYAYNDVEA